MASGKLSTLMRPSLYWCLAFISLALYLEHFQDQAHLWNFFSSCLAIIPLASLLGEAMEHIAERAGHGVGGLLNATFGNAAALIIAIVALRSFTTSALLTSASTKVHSASSSPVCSSSMPSAWSFRCTPIKSSSVG